MVGTLLFAPFRQDQFRSIRLASWQLIWQTVFYIGQMTQQALARRKLRRFNGGS
jgi:hypothetical protein